MIRSIFVVTLLSYCIALGQSPHLGTGRAPRLRSRLDPSASGPTARHEGLFALGFASSLRGRLSILLP